jgi:hypothetical protein
MNSCLIKTKTNTRFWWTNRLDASKNELFERLLTDS